MYSQAFNPYRPQPQAPRDVPQGLELLMQLAKVATPMGPAGPTVASQLMQRVQQPSMSSAPQMEQPQAPQPRMMPGAPNQGPQGMMDTLKAQSQQSAQPPQQPPGPPPQGMARGGIASLRADNISRMKYAQGGVIGYSGEDDDQLVQPTADKILQAIEIEKAKRARALANEYKQSLGVMSAVANSGDQSALQQYASTTQQTLDALRKHVADSYGNRATDVMNTLLASQAAPQASAKPFSEYTDPNRARLDAPTPAPAPRPPAPPRPAAPAATGIAQLAAENPDLVVARRLRDAQFTGTAPTIEGTLAEQQRFRAAQGLTGPVGSAIEDAMKAHAEREAATKAAYQKGQEGQGAEEWISMLTAGRRGVGSLGEQFVRGREAQRAAEMNFQQLMNTSAEKREQMGITLQNLREAEANRDYTAYQKNLDEFRKQKHDFDTVQRQLAASTLQGSVQMQEGAANRASQEKIARIREASQLGQLDMRRQAMAAQAAKAVEMDPLLKQLATLAMAGDPAATKRYQDREAEIYMRIAPELMLGGGAPSGGSALASATAIARGKQ